MTHAIIDIGSNSMRLTVYQVENHTFKILFKEKIMAGLAGFVENGYLTQAGIYRARDALQEFGNVLSLLDLRDRVHVLATASLRNIRNTRETVEFLTRQTGFSIDVISGKEEAVYGYRGAMYQFAVSEGAFLDIGGASTEITIFRDGQVQTAESCPVGSLLLYKNCVKKILPGAGSRKRIEEMIAGAIPQELLSRLPSHAQLICMGGTCRAVGKLARKLNLMDSEIPSLSLSQLDKVGQLLLGEEKLAADTILQVDPVRIHTIVPGYLVLSHIAHALKPEQLLISDYGVREGYLAEKVL